MIDYKNIEHDSKTIDKVDKILHDAIINIFDELGYKASYKMDLTHHFIIEMRTQIITEGFECYNIKKK